MNSYYHDFVPGFNWWYVVAPLLTALVVFVGFEMYYMGNNLKIRRRYNGRLITAISVISAVIIAVMMFCESFSGIIQYFDNGLNRYESPFYSLILAGMAIAFLAVLYAIGLIAVSTKVAELKCMFLVKKRMKMRVKAYKQGQNGIPRA